jgi:hypothetical protein
VLLIFSKNASLDARDPIAEAEARRLAQLEFKPCLAYDAVIANAIFAAEKILRRIDSHWSNREHDRAF